MKVQLQTPHGPMQVHGENFEDYVVDTAVSFGCANYPGTDKSFAYLADWESDHVELLGIFPSKLRARIYCKMQSKIARSDCEELPDEGV